MRACETRWLTKLYLLQSIYDNLEDLVKMKADQKFSKYFDPEVRTAVNLLSDSTAELSALINLLKVFKEPVQFFQNSNIPLIHAVWPLLLKLKV